MWLTMKRHSAYSLASGWQVATYKFCRMSTQTMIECLTGTVHTVCRLLTLHSDHARRAPPPRSRRGICTRIRAYMARPGPPSHLIRDSRLKGVKGVFIGFSDLGFLGGILCPFYTK